MGFAVGAGVECKQAGVAFASGRRAWEWTSRAAGKQVPAGCLLHSLGLCCCYLLAFHPVLCSRAPSLKMP